MYDNSLSYPPWQEENTPPLALEETAEEFRLINLEHEVLRHGNTRHTFLKDQCEV